MKMAGRICLFTSLWSYPNLYRKSGKGLTDLLVVFGDDVILFSDKSCAFPDGDDANLDWKCWFRRSIIKSAAQITQAEEWIERQPSRVFLDAKATQPLPVSLPPADRMRDFQVCIALGAAERCKSLDRLRDAGALTAGFMSSMTHPFQSSW